MLYFCVALAAENICRSSSWWSCGRVPVRWLGISVPGFVSACVSRPHEYINI